MPFLFQKGLIFESRFNLCSVDSVYYRRHKRTLGQSGELTGILKKLLKYSFLLSYLFWGGLVLYSLLMGAMYNIHFNLFSEKCDNVKAFEIKPSLREGKLDINYTYSSKNKNFTVSDSFFKEVFENRVGKNPSTLTVCYNASFPQYNYIEGVNFKSRYFNTGLAIGGFFLVLTLLFDLFGNKSKMAEKYERAFEG